MTYGVTGVGREAHVVTPEAMTYGVAGVGREANVDTPETMTYATRPANNAVAAAAPSAPW